MAASQFDYATMQTAQAEISEMGKAIANFVLDIAAEGKAAVDGCYTGEAATAYTTAFQNVAESVNAAIEQINKNLAEELEKQQTEYTNKEQQMMDSVNIPTLGN